MTSPDAYAPPKSALADPASLLREPLPPRSAMMGAVAVLCGLAVDIGGSLLASVVILLLHMFFLQATGVPTNAAHAVMLDTRSLLSGWNLFGMLAGSGMSVLGGYTCARIARRSDYRLGVVMAVLSATIGLVMFGDSYGLGVDTLLLAATVACVLLGTHLGRAPRWSA